MGRLTYKNANGTWGLKNYDITQVPRELYGAMCKLKDYEESGLAPNQLEEIRNKTIDDAIEASAKAICIGCGYLDGRKCTYTGDNCSVSQPMLDVVVKALEQMKGGAA